MKNYNFIEKNEYSFNIRKQKKKKKIFDHLYFQIFYDINIQNA